MEKIEKSEVGKAWKWVERCAPLADELVVESSKMIEQSDWLKNLTEKAFLETQRNDVENTGEMRKTSKHFDDSNFILRFKFLYVGLFPKWQISNGLKIFKSNV